MSFKRPGVSYKKGKLIEPTNLRKSQVEDFAAQVADVYKFKAGEDRKRLANRLGGAIHYQAIEEWLKEDGPIFVHGEEDFDILLPQYTSPLRDRFTVAHELGH